ncbi:cationic amino acid transporter 4-like [Patiria miniata]|uniref:Cationic amino acid transporter C-terminal domain-containing protein n=1 Tax=Patiria miniata TaxID=46514 RepID=A0A914BLY4_PATMI|nr:cationic amino acid transporter 4-like [Patiria miniata]XP_038076939.1 cationic amino acid transporter 4-like [Patiria miniata]XP_038076940.1 cationic amino acid transporter 4-like [Patiria miniata]
MGFLRNLVRLKTVDLNPEYAPLRRCLNTLDLTLLGIASMMGVTLYILTGVIASDAGPSVALSFLIASIAAMFAAVCYAELGSIFTRTGSAYLFTYSTIGELPAFIAGWSIILEYLLSSSVVARGWSGYLDSMLDNRIQNFTRVWVMGGELWDTPVVASYPDLVAGIFMFCFFVIIALGAKISANFNKALVAINLTIVTLITIGGFMFADGRNWSDHGFFPNGFQATLSGASIVFIGFVGFDIIVVSSEEAIDSQKGVPRAVITSIAVVTLVYTLVSVSLTLAVPYSEIDLRAVLATPFVYHGLSWAKNVVDAGALCAMSGCILCSIFALPRMAYAMSTDGVFFKVFGRVNPTTHTPLIATIFFGIIAILMTVFIDIKTLSSVLSIGTLTAFTLVAASVMVIRYKPSQLTHQIQKIALVTSQKGDSDHDTDTISDKSSFLDPREDKPIQGGTLKPKFRFLTVMARYEPGVVPMICFFATTCLQFATIFVIVVFMDNIQSGDWWAILLVIVFGSSAILLIVPIPLHEQVDTKSNFKTPFVPLTPMLSILCNIILIMLLSPATWLRFAIWIVMGIAIYFLYGYWHSAESFAVKTVSFSSKAEYTRLKTDDEGAEQQCVMEGSLNMPQPHKKEKEEYLD